MSLLRKVASLFESGERVRGALLLLALVVAAALETVGVGLVMPFIALVTNPELAESSAPLRWLGGVLGATDHATLLIECGALLLVFYAFKGLFLGVLTHAQNTFVYGKMERLSAQLLRAYLSAPYAFHVGRNSAELQRNVNTDLPLCFNWVVTHAFLLVSDTLVVVVLSALLVAFSPAASLVALVVLGGLALVYVRLVRSRTEDLGAIEQHSFGQMVKWVNQGLGALKETRVRGVEEFFIERYARECAEYARARRTLQTVTEVPRLLLETVAVGGVVGVMLVAVARGEDAAALVPLVALFGAAAFRLLPAFTRIIRSLHLVRHFRPSLDTVLADMRLLDGIPEAESSHAGAEAARVALVRDLEFRDVGFGYAGAQEPVLRGVSFRIERGQCVGIVGSSGAGKTTVVDLMLGLFAPTTGGIFADGRDVGGDLVGWRRNFGYIPQEIYLTDDTIRRNVAFGVPDHAIDDDAIWRALRAARLDDFTRQLSGQLDHEVGEGGVRISGGQRQRLGIARALYHDPAILVMDEATSALDAQTERAITETTLRLAGERTVIIIAHRLSTLEGCDRLLFLKDGVVEAEGSYAELATDSSSFRAMARLS